MILNIDFEKINYKKENNFYSINYDNKAFIISVKNVLIPFGVEKNFSNYIIKVSENENSKDLFNFIHKFENNNIDYLKSIESSFKEEDYKSQILKKDNYSNLLIIKIPIVKNQIQVEIKKDNNIISMFDIPKKAIVSLDIEIDTIWFFKGKYSCIPKTKTMRLMN